MKSPKILLESNRGHKDKLVMEKKALSKAFFTEYPNVRSLIPIRGTLGSKPINLKKTGKRATFFTLFWLGLSCYIIKT